jgi:glycosyltransferase involved in cell wall biosynthesis
LKPAVTVIIPVLNNCAQLKKTLGALRGQTYPQEKIEVIVVDNGSDENMQECVRKYSVELLYQTSQKSPYAARNTGFDASKGDIIAFTDSNKTPSAEWIEEGVKSLINENADLVGGDIFFPLSKSPSASEVFDSLYFNNNKILVQRENAAVTGNLLVKREVMEKIGPFPSTFRSGMDVWWTQKAVNLGYKLIFSNKARVACKARTFKSLMGKSVRVGRSHPFIKKEAGDSVYKILFTIVRTFLPPRLTDLNKQIQNSEFNSTRMLLKLWAVAWAYKCCLGIGRIIGLKRLNDTNSRRFD